MDDFVEHGDNWREMINLSYSFVILPIFLLAMKTIVVWKSELTRK